MKNSLILLTIFVSLLLIINHQMKNEKVINPDVVVNQIGGFDNLVLKIKEADISSVGYKRLIPVLDKITSTESLKIYTSEEITTALDSIKGEQRLRLFIFNKDKPLMKVEVLSDSTRLLRVVEASLVIS